MRIFMKSNQPMYIILLYAIVLLCFITPLVLSLNYLSRDVYEKAENAFSKGKAELGIKLLSSVLDEDNGKAANVIGNAFYVLGDKEQSCRYLWKSHSQGFSHSSFYAAECIIDGYIDDQNLSNAYHILNALIDNSQSYSQRYVDLARFRMGEVLIKLDHENSDIEKGLVFLTDGANNCDIRSLLALMHYYQSEGRSESFEKFGNKLKKAFDEWSKLKYSCSL